MIFAVLSSPDRVGRTYLDPSCIELQFHYTESLSAVENFRCALRALPRDEDDEVLGQLVRELSRLHFYVNHLPLPLWHPILAAMAADNLIASALGRLTRCPAERRGAYEAAIAARCAFGEVNEAPFVSDLVHLIGSRPLANSAIVLLRSDWVKSVRSYFNVQPMLKSLTIASAASGQLQDTRIFDRLFLCGAVKNYPEAVFMAPRSQNVTWLVAPWMKTQLQPAASLGQYRLSSSSKTRALPLEEDVVELPPVSQELRVVLHDEGSDRLDDQIVARRVLLRGGLTAYVPSSRGVQCLELEHRQGEYCGRLISVPGKELQPGDYLVLASRSTHDYIVLSADGLLGQEAITYRESHRRWKNAFRALLDELGVQATVDLLRSLGSGIAQPMNAKNWAADWLIRPNGYEDFAAIMQAIGMTDESAVIWSQMTRLRTAHQRAGREVFHKLRQALDAKPLTEAVLEGREQLSLTGEDGAGAWTLMQVLDIGIEDISVPADRLMEPIR